MRGLRDMTFSPQYLVAANLVLLAFAAYFSSGIVGTALAARLVPPLQVELSEPPPPIPQDPPKPLSYYSIIDQRDIFNSVKPEPAHVESAPPPTTPLKLKLWGVAVHARGDSYAIIEDESARDKKQGLFRINEQVGSTGAVVKSVEWDRVVLNRNGQDEVLELEQADTRPGAAAGPQVAAPRVPPPPASDAHVQATGENEFTIDRAEVDSALENMSQLFTQIRAVPHFEGGKSIGFRLFAIRSGSIFDKIGLKNGDIIQRINGSEMSDPSKALQLLQELRSESDLSVEVVRNRQPMTLSYSIR
jgi:general secretion pathway protein C